MLVCLEDYYAHMKLVQKSHELVKIMFKSKPTGSFSLFHGRYITSIHPWLFLSDTGSELFLYIRKQKSACI